jgi:hypothetical protein
MSKIKVLDSESPMTQQQNHGVELSTAHEHHSKGSKSHKMWCGSFRSGWSFNKFAYFVGSLNQSWWKNK